MLGNKKKFDKKNLSVPDRLPVQLQEEKKDCLFFDEDLRLNKTIGFVHVEDKFIVTNREDISDRIYDNIRSLKLQAANGKFNGEDVHKNYHALTNPQFIKSKIQIEIQQLLYSAVEAKITSFINSLLKEDKKISTGDIIDPEDCCGYYTHNIESSSYSELSLRTTLLNIMNNTNSTLQKKVLAIVYNIKVSDLYEECDILINNEKAMENINDFIFMVVSEKIVEAMNIFGDGLNLILHSSTSSININNNLNEKLDIIRKENTPKRKIEQCHECEY